MTWLAVPVWSSGKGRLWQGSPDRADGGWAGLLLLLPQGLPSEIQLPVQHPSMQLLGWRVLECLPVNHVYDWRHYSAPGKSGGSNYDADHLLAEGQKQDLCNVWPSAAATGHSYLLALKLCFVSGKNPNLEELI